MCARSEIDKKNMAEVDRVLKDYPQIFKKYINGLSKKTSYTKKAYAYYLRNFIEYLKNNSDINIKNNKNFSKILPMDINEYMNYIGVKENGEEKSATYLVANLAAINGFFKFLLANGIIDKNPCDTIESPKDNKEHEIVTIDEDDLDIIIDNIYNGVGSEKARSTQEKWINRDIALVTLGMTTGLRVSAICGIDVGDINFEEGYISVTEKGNKQRKIYIGTRTKVTLKKWIKDRSKMTNRKEKALFICQTGTRISCRAVQNRFKQITEGTGKRITPHKMRATCATTLYEKTGDIYMVQRQLGHKNIENTKRYAKISVEKEREAASILDCAF